MDISSDLAVFLLVLAARLLVPLAIPKLPLPAILASLIIDGVDQAIYQRYTSYNLEGYQGYDKALDVHYLTIAYLSTMRNWVNPHAFAVGRFLFYYRLVGVMLIEFLHVGAILLIFPNTFEYFFIFGELVRLRWHPARISRKAVFGVGALIWVVIKLPQEYWIHIARRDLSDTLMANPVLIPILAGVILVLLTATRWLVINRLPPADREIRLVAPDPFSDDQLRQSLSQPPEQRTLDRGLFEKAALVTLVTIIFSQILPNVRATPFQIAVGVSLLIVANSAVSERLARRGVGLATVVQEFVAICAINAGLFIAAQVVLSLRGGSLHAGNTLFFLLLISLLVTLYDRYRPVHLARIKAGTISEEPQTVQQRSVQST